MCALAESRTVTGKKADTQLRQKPLKLVIVGHVDHGKSTLIGRILYDTHSLPDGRVEKIRRICEEQHKPFELAFLLDALEEEQLQGITIDTTQIAFQTENRDFLIIDAPGHQEFLKNMISGAANADAAVLIIDAHEGIREQSRRHGYLLSLLGITNVIVVVNKMDLVGFRQQAFEDIRVEYLAFLKELGITPKQVIPVSAREGDNVVQSSKKLTWYQDGPLLKALEKLQARDLREAEGLRLTVQDVYKFDERRIIAGRVESGSVRVGDEIEILPTGHRAKVHSIESWPERPGNPQRVDAGFTVGITLDEQLFVDRGHVIVHPGKGPKPTRFVTTNIFWMGNAPLVYGKRYKIKIGTQEVGGFVHRINRVLNSSTIEMVANAAEVGRHEVGEVVFRAEQNLVVDPFEQFTHTGRLVVVDGYDIAGGGIILNAGLGQEQTSGPITLKEREQASGHRSGIVQVFGKNPQEVTSLIYQLERLLFEAGFHTYALTATNTANLQTTLTTLTDAGLLVLMPGSVMLPGTANRKTYAVKADWPEPAENAATQQILLRETDAIRQAFSIYLDEAAGI